jgi:2-polyprenyl-3-methyl-5-hydroxy-6-metoxy-1,4-benzoquinol methylase
MDRCLVCDSVIFTNEANSFILENVPASTFNFSEEIVKLHIVQCKECGCVQLYNVPLSKDYEAVYRSIGISSLRERKKNELDWIIRKYKINQDSKLIEIGCGDGQYLEIFKELGYKCEGLEVGDENSLYCSAKGFENFHGTVFDIEGQYDAFFCFYYLEHLPYPVDFIHNIYGILKPGGIGVIEVPSYDQIEKNSVWMEFTKDHVLYFRKRTLSYLLFKCGFEIEKLSKKKIFVSQQLLRSQKIVDFTV